MLASSQDSASPHQVMDALPYLSGMLMVMISLALLWGICVITAWLVRVAMPDKIPSQQSAPAADPHTSLPAAPAPQPPAPAADAAIPPEIIAVIAAAVASVTGNRKVRIVSIKPMSTSWERAGRQSVLTSHRIR